MKIREYIVTQDENGMFHFGDELIRCKDCKYFVTNYAITHCGRTLIGMKQTDFCNYGERKENVD